MHRSRCVAVASAAALLLALASPSVAQAPDAPPVPHQHEHTAEGPPTALFPTRDSSGTAWLPDATPMRGIHRSAKGWSVMLHGQGFAQFVAESGAEHRRARQAGSVNWGMLMARRLAGRGRVGLRLMASAEPLTISGCGYPNLLATGEVCDGDTIHDRQHPHDAVMELAADYDRALTSSLRWQVYAGLAGEPALGPPGFPHRTSATPNPIAPLAHHWLDSTHVSFGVVTGAVYSARWKAELSAFNGREPDEGRGGIDLAPLDSVAGRVSYLGARGVVLQVSAGRLNDAEGALGSLPAADVTRVTVSAAHHRVLGRDRHWATVLAYGVNVEPPDLAATTLGARDERTHALLFESSLGRGERDTWFGRFEVAGKPAHDLHAHEFADRVFTIGKLQGGYVRHLPSWRSLVPGVGATVSASLLPALLAPRYDGRVAPGAGVFFTLRPARHMM
jgi:hypothetical protein